jgi:hypothetical protein
MKTTNKLSKWCKNTLMLPIVAVVLTFTSCQKDDLLFDAAPGASPAGATAGNVITLDVGVTATTYTFDFENTAGSGVYAADEAGSNLYSGPFPGYKDPIGVWFMPTHTGNYGFASGGIAFSRWNDTITAGYANQCSVYYVDPVTGNGGHNGSQIFALHYGYNDTGYGFDSRTIIRLADSTQTCTFDSFWVMNSTYAARAMKYGQGGKIFNYADQDWFRLIIDGLDMKGNIVSNMYVYLADFRTSTSPGVIENWMQVNLRPLGKVTAIRFDLQSTDSSGGSMNTPAYFCFDDLTVILP